MSKKKNKRFKLMEDSLTKTKTNEVNSNLLCRTQFNVKPNYTDIVFLSCIDINFARSVVLGYGYDSGSIIIPCLDEKYFTEFGIECLMAFKFLSANIINLESTVEHTIVHETLHGVLSSIGEMKAANMLDIVDTHAGKSPRWFSSEDLYWTDAIYY